MVEGWAATALAPGNAVVAERAYRDTLKRGPGGGGGYFGLAIALRAQHKAADAEKVEIKGREA